MMSRILLITAGCFCFSLPLFAQDDPAGQAAAPEPSGEEVEEAGLIGDSAEDPDAPAEGEEEAAGAAEARAQAADDLSIFVPTREGPPDEQVVFPVDI